MDEKVFFPAIVLLLPVLFLKTIDPNHFQWMVQQVKQDQEDEKTASLKQGGIYHFRNMEGVFKTAVIFPLHKVGSPCKHSLCWHLLFQGMVGLSKALRVFEDEGLNLVHIESRKVKGSKDKVTHSSLQYSHLHVRRSCTWRSTVRRARTGTRSSMSSTPCAGSTSAPLTRLHKIYHQHFFGEKPF